jgi:hypothetical protein
MSNNAWNDLEVGSNGGKFIKLVEGANKLRIVSAPISYWKNLEHDPKLTYLTKEAAAKDKDAKLRFMCWAIDRADNAIKKLDFTGSIAGQIKALIQDPEYAFEGALFPYDITINRAGSGLETRYTVTAARQNTALTDVEQAAVALLQDMRMEMRNEAEDGDQVAPF